MTTTLITGATRGLGRETASRLTDGAWSVEQGAEVIVRMATIGPDGPTGTFTEFAGTVPW